MLTLLHIDASARGGRSDKQSRGSHTRRLSARFVEHWIAARPADRIIYRDVGAHSPRPVSARWIEAAFTPPAMREEWMEEILAESDTLTAELIAADIIVFGAPMYNFGMPAQLKAWVDNIVRVGLTFGFDRRKAGDPYWPLLSDHRKTAVILTSRGDYGYNVGERIADRELVIPGLKVPLTYIGITDVRALAVEYDEYGGERLEASLADAELALGDLAKQLVYERSQTDNPSAREVA